jgi:sigma-B regulation protein RsbU (phosphoserine phosphatase)
VERLNTFLFDDLERRQFVTMVLGVIDPFSWKLTWANMGHPSAYMLDRNGAVKETMNSTSRPLGLFADCNQCEARSTSMEPGEMLIVFTDGLTEIASAEGLEFEASNLLEAARNYKERSARELVEGILHAGRTFAGGPLQRDDITVVVFKRTH